MATYTVSYRGKNGERIEEQFEAPDRNSLFKILADRKISAISVKDGAAPKRKKSSAPSKPLPPSVLRGAVAGVVLVALAVVIWSFISKREEAPQAEEATNKKGLIKEVAFEPSKAPTNVQEEVVVKVDPNARPTKVGEIVNGYIMLPSGRIHHIKGEYTNTTVMVKADYDIFNHYAENQIACYLSIEPGTALVGTPHYNGKFTKDFLESLKEPLIPPADATEEQRELYKAVRDAKIELKAAYDRGEDIEKIMLDTRRELQDMGRYKMTLQNEVRDLLRSGDVDIKGVEDVVQAANKMLEAKGIAPMDFGPIAKRRFERYVENSVLNQTEKGN